MKDTKFYLYSIANFAFIWLRYSLYTWKNTLVFSDAKLQTTRSAFLYDPSEELLHSNIWHVSGSKYKSWNTILWFLRSPAQSCRKTDMNMILSYLHLSALVPHSLSQAILKWSVGGWKSDGKPLIFCHIINNRIVFNHHCPLKRTTINLSCICINLVRRDVVTRKWLELKVYAYLLTTRHSWWRLQCLWCMYIWW